MNQVFDIDTVHIHIMHGDITTRAGVDSRNIVAKLGDEIKAAANAYHF